MSVPSAIRDEYGATLDRLNASLSDLQLEIARLTQQQQRMTQQLAMPPRPGSGGRATWRDRAPITEIRAAEGALRRELFGKLIF